MCFSKLHQKILSDLLDEYNIELPQFIERTQRMDPESAELLSDGFLKAAGLKF